MRIELTCACGQSVAFDDQGKGTYINTGGTVNASGHKYVVEQMAEKWRSEHFGHSSRTQIRSGEKSL